MMKVYLVFALLAVFSPSVSHSQYIPQWQDRLPSSQGSTRLRSCENCFCTQEYIPFCGTNGRDERTYSNRCELQCAQSCNAGLRIKFEGVCAKSYTPTGGSSIGNGGRLSTPVFSGSGSTIPNGGRPRPTTVTELYAGSSTSRYETGSTWGSPGSRPLQTTKRPVSSQYTSAISTIRPWFQPQYPQQSGSKYPASSNSYGNRWRQNRDVEDDSGEYEDDK